MKRSTILRTFFSVFHLGIMAFFCSGSWAATGPAAQTYSHAGYLTTAPGAVSVSVVRIGVVVGSVARITGFTSGPEGTSVQSLEVSTDGGASWSPATDTSGLGSWSTWGYEWTPAASGTCLVLLRATEAGSGALQSRGALKTTVDTVTPAPAVQTEGAGVLVNTASAKDYNGGTDNVAPAYVRSTSLSSLVVAGGLSPLRQEWKYASFGSGIGLTGMQVSDIDGDGAPEMVMAGSSGNGFGGDDNWYVVRKTGTNTYGKVWSSDLYASQITRLTVKDGDLDGVPEIYVGLADGTVDIYDGRTKRLEGSVTTAGSVSALAVADTDGDGTREIITSDGTRIQVFSGAGLDKIWESPAYGGSDIAVGNVDNDPGQEIVSSSGYVIDGVTHALEWSYSPGFGYKVGLGDVDKDGMDEIVGAATWYHITAFDADVKSPKWQINTALDIDSLLVSDVDGDDVPEVVYGDGQWGKIHCFNGSGTTEKWNISNPEHGVTDVAVADVDNDGKPEVIWGAGWTSTGPDYLYVADMDTLSIQWKSADIDGPFSAVDAGDVDGDGKDEIVMVSYASDSYYENPVILVFDGQTHVLRGQSALSGIYAWCGVGSVKVMDADNDGANEIVVATAHLYDGLVQYYDGKTLALKRQTGTYNGVSLTAMAVGDVDNDGRTEIVVGELREHTGAAGVNLVVLDAATGAEKWKSIDLGVYWGHVHDIKLADMDKDGHTEIIASMAGNYLYAFDGVNHVEKRLLNIPAYAVEVADADGDGSPEVMVGRGDGKVDVYDGATFSLEASYQLGTGIIYGLKVGEVEPGKGSNWIVCAEDTLSLYDGTDQSLLFRDKGIGGSLAGFNHILTHDFFGDGIKKVVIGSATGLYQYGPISFFSVITSPQDGETLYSLGTTVNGRADAPMGVSFVEVSTDNGITWARADGTTDWSYSWNIPGAGSYTIISRATDSDGNQEIPALGVTVKVVLPRSLVLQSDPADGGYVVANPQGPYKDGDSVSLHAYPNAGYEFAGWTGSASGTSQAISISMDSDKIITASFAKLAPVRSLYLPANPAEGGWVSVSPGGVHYDGDVVTLTAHPAPGYSFSGWSGDASGSDNPRTLTLDSDKTVTANFASLPLVYNVSVASSPSGSGTVSVSPAGPYYNGQAVTLTAHPGSGYAFDSWGGDGAGSINPLTITMNADKSVGAYFTKIPITYSLTTNVAPTGGGNLVVSSGGPFAEGSLVTLTAVPSPGYAFSGWSGDGSGTDNPLSVTMDSNKSVIANFASLPYLSDISHGFAAGGIQVTLSGAGFGKKPGAVYMGAKKVHVSSWSDTSIVFKTPSKMPVGSYYVFAATSDGKQTNRARLWISAPVVTGLLPNHAPASGSASLSGGRFGPKPRVFFASAVAEKRYKAKVVVSDDGNILFVVPKTAPGSYFVTVVTPQGESDPLEFTIE